ncbi:g10454 [Coccomyxa elongata]
MLIGLPVILPLLALYASRRRESIKVQAGLQELQQSWSVVLQQLDQHEEVKVQKLQQAFQLWRDDLQKQLPTGKLKSIESKLAALEGSVLSAGRSAQSAARNVEVASSSMAESTALQLKELGSQLIRELQQDLQNRSVAPKEELNSLVAQLEGIKGSLQGLEESQMQSMRRLAQNVVGAVEDAEASMQGTMQADSRRSMDALERLPALLAASLPVTDVTPLQNMAARQQPPALAQIAPADRVWLQGVLENALQLAAERVLKKQETAGAAVPAMLADEQWDALGKRLRGIEQSVEGLLEGSGEADASPREEALVNEIAALRSDVSAALKDVRESDGRASPELAPLLSSINSSLEALRSQVEGPLSGSERFAEQSRLPSDILQPIQLALDDLKTSQASLQQALEGTGETSSTAAMSTDFVEQAARKAAKEVLREFSAQSPDTFELRETISATLTAVRQLEVATMERISSLASSISALPAGTLPTVEMQTALPETPGLDAPPKGYKGDPSDTREAAFLRMQALLREQNKKSSAEVAWTVPDAAVAAETPKSDESKSPEDLVPISAWLGPRNGAAESMPEPQMAWDQSSNGALASASTSQSIPKVSPEAPEATSSSATGNRASQTGDIPYTAALAQEAETSAGPVQDSGWGQQGGNSAEEQGYHSRGQQPAGGSKSSEQAAEPADIPDSARGGYTGAAPLASNGAGVNGSNMEEQLEALVQEGKQFLREGRELTKSGFDLGGADLALQDAMACFEDAAQIDSTSIKVQGNWGNALMAYGVLKKRYLSELRQAPPPRSYEERAAARASEDQLIDEAEAALVAAGQKFLAVVERDQDDTRALGNWGRALCLRAELARDPEVACALYEAAVAKFEAVLEADPSNGGVLRNCAFALYDLARLQPDPVSRATRQLLEDAARYLQDVLTLNGSDEDAAVALDVCVAELDQLQTARR